MAPYGVFLNKCYMVIRIFHVLIDMGEIYNTVKISLEYQTLVDVNFPNCIHEYFCNY